MAQWERICLSIQEMPETRVQSLGCKEPLEGENGNPLQDSCLGNPVNIEACRTAAVRVAKSQEQNGEPQSKHLHLQAIDLGGSRQEDTMEKSESLE